MIRIVNRLGSVAANFRIFTVTTKTKRFAMAQKSIMSFFNKVPDVRTVSTKSVDNVDEDSNSPIKIKRSKKRILNSDSEDDSPPEKRVQTDSLVEERSEKKTTVDIKSEDVENKSEDIEENGKLNNSEDDKSPSDGSKENSPKAKSPATAKNSKKDDSKAKKKEGKKKKETTSSPKATKKDNKNKKKDETTPPPQVPKEDSKIKEEVKKKTMSPQASKEKPINPFFNCAKTKQENEMTQKSITPSEYDPTKPKYNPVDDACWERGQKVPYLALARTLEEIEKISARLKIIDILSNFFRSLIVLTPEDLLPSVYLCLNKLAPAYESVELGVAETNLIKAVAQSTGRTPAQIKSDVQSSGDIGIVAEQSKSNQRMMFQPAPLTVRGVFDKLKEIAHMTGHSSMTKKIDKIQSLFVACRLSEARYLIRSLAGKLRIGLAEQSVLQALAVAYTQTPPLFSSDEWPPKVLCFPEKLNSEQYKSTLDENARIVKTAYCQCPNYDIVIPTLLKYGISELLVKCEITPGIPLKPMLAHPTKGVGEVLQRFENLEFTCEWKYDGERAQIHVPNKSVDGSTVVDTSNATIYSRNLENNTSKYPDVLTRLTKTLSSSVTSCVLDCEAVAWDIEKKQIRPFQILSTRKRKDAKESEIKVAVCLFMFDLLYLNGESLVKKPFQERRSLLKKHFVEVEGEWHFATSLDCQATESIQEFLEESIRGNCEGLMVKTLKGKDATYEIAKRSRNWLKLKKDYIEGIGDTIDAVVLGGYLGHGKRTGVYGGFLLACYDKETEEYQTLCKIGTGFSDEDLQSHTNMLKEFIIDGPRNYYRYDTSLEPDHWFSPQKVWEVKCGDLSLSPIHRAAIGVIDPEKGISLRFPRFIRLREDKTAEEATSAHQIAELYSNQDQVKNQAQGNANFAEEDFY